MALYKIILFFISFLALQNQGISNDTLNIVNEKGKINEINDLISKIGKPEKIIELAQQSLDLAISINDKNQQALSLKQIASGYQMLNNYEKAISYYNKAIDISSQIKSNKILSACLYNLGLVYLNTGDFTKALEFSNQALELDEKYGTRADIASSLNAIGIIYENLGIYDKSLDYNLRSLKLNEEINDKKGMANSYLNAGIVYEKLGDRKNALVYFENALKLNKELNDNVGLAKTFYTVGGFYEKQEIDSLALAYYHKSLSIRDSIDKFGISACLNSIGNIYKSRGNYSKALDYYLKSLKIKSEINDKNGYAIALGNLGIVYYLLGQNDKALNYMNLSLNIALENNSKNLVKDIYKILSDIYFSKKDVNKSLEYFKLYSVINDSIYSEESRRKIAEMQIRFETEKKDKENEILKQSSKIQALEIKRQKNLMVFLVLFLAMAITIGFILYSRYRIKKKANEEISNKNRLLEQQNIEIAFQKNEIEKKNINITESIHYARVIQLAMLNKEENIKKILPELFIFYRPRDIVSGDFYWFGEVENKIYIAVIDCTGHGVPGALMSMMGNSYLNQIICSNRITSPDEILAELHKNIYSALRQEETKNIDGMEMAICLIDTHNQIIEYSGAQIPLIIIKNTELTVIKGSKSSIGGYQFQKQPDFVKHQIKYDPSTYFYMFSDGYIDQFGGEKNKKFLFERFKSLLLEIHTLPLTDQKVSLETTLINWMGNKEQIDDILVVGFIVL